jgi:N-methylhydantoinase A
MHRGGEASAQLDYTLFLDMRYAKQGYEISVAVAGAPREVLDAARITALFHETYGRIFGRLVEGAPIEIAAVRLFARSQAFASISQHAAVAQSGGSARRVSRRRSIYLKERGGFVDCEVLDRTELRKRGRMDGPLLIEDRETSILLDAGATARVDEFGHVAAELH